MLITASKITPNSIAVLGFAVRVQDEVTGCEMGVFADSISELVAAVSVLDGAAVDQSKIYRVVYFKAEDVTLNIPEDNGDLF